MKILKKNSMPSDGKIVKAHLMLGKQATQATLSLTQACGNFGKQGGSTTELGWLLPVF